jgi:hypothetical protein
VVSKLRTPHRHVFIRVQQQLREIGSLHTTTRECPAQQVTSEQENILHAVEHSPKTSIRRMSCQKSMPPTQALQPQGYPAHLGFCQWTATHHHLCKYILFTEKVQFT